MNGTEMFEVMWKAKCESRYGGGIMMHATLKRDVTMDVWNGTHPVEKNTKMHVATAGTRVLVTMASRFGDVGIRDENIDSLTHGYYARVDPSDLEDCHPAVLSEAATITGGGS
jgi:hypothetical protein